MTVVPYSYVLALSAAIFVIGVAGVLMRRNVLVMFMSIELMLNAVNLAFIGLGQRIGSMDGQVSVFFVMTVGPAEAAVGPKGCGPRASPPAGSAGGGPDAAPMRRLAGPVGDMILKRAGRVLLHHLAGDRDPGTPRTVRIAGDQRVPARQILAFRQKAIGTGGRQPVDFPQGCGGEADAIGNALMAVLIIPAQSGPTVEQAAGDIGEGEFARVLVAELVQATTTASVAERFPLSRGHSFKRLGPPERPVLPTRHGAILTGFGRRWNRHRRRQTPSLVSFAQLPYLPSIARSGLAPGFDTDILTTMLRAPTLLP